MRKKRRQYRRKRTSKTDAERLGELKAALPTADADFLISELLKDSSVAQATKKYITQLETQHSKLADENVRLKASYRYSGAGFPRLAKA